MHMTDQERAALDAARHLVSVGVPVFAAPPCPEGCPGVTKPDGTHVPHNGGLGKYHLPRQWEKTYPAEVNLEKWRPGWGLGAVGGHVVDFLDVDPRSGGTESLAQLRELGQMPRAFAVARTPSGGTHYMISVTGERKYTGFMPGLDLQSGAAGGHGRGFVWIAPTIRASKANHEAGTLRAYAWEVLPNLEEIEEWRGAHDPTIEPIVARVRARRAVPATRDPAAVVVDPDDPFLTASMSMRAGGVDRSFSVQEAMDFIRSYLIRLRESPIGMIEENCNVAATVLSHFVPNFWTPEGAMALLQDALTHTAYDPNGPSDWTVEKFAGVLNGTRPVQDPWTATRKPDPAAPPSQTLESSPGEEGLTTLERLRRRLVNAEEMSLQGAPEPLVWGLLDMDTEAWMIGAPGSLKSFVALDIAGHVAAGREWQGHRVRQAKVLFVAAEGQRGSVLRVRAYLKVHGSMTDVTFLPYPVQVRSTDGQWDALVELAREIGPGLIVLDTQARVSVGLEENSAKDMGELISAVSKLKRATGACILTIHHTGRNGGDARGSSALDGAQDTELKVVRDLPRSSLACHIVMDKQKDMAEDMEGLALRFKVIDLGVDPVTGRELTSLVLQDKDVYADAQGHEVTAEMRRQPWLPSFHAADVWRRRYLDTLHTFAPAQGLTKPDLDRVMVEHWDDFNPRAGGPKKAWKDLLDTTDPAGESIVGKVGGERYLVTSLVVRQALDQELGTDRRPEMTLPGLSGPSPDHEHVSAGHGPAQDHGI